MAAAADRDWRDVLAHLRAQLDQAGFEIVNDEIFRDFAFSHSAQTDFSRYLQGVIQSLKRRSKSSYAAALGKLQDNVATEDGQPVSGIEVRLSEPERGLYGANAVDLATIEDYGELIGELQRLGEDLAEDGGDG